MKNGNKTATQTAKMAYVGQFLTSKVALGSTCSQAVDRERTVIGKIVANDGLFLTVKALYANGEENTVTLSYSTFMQYKSTRRIQMMDGVTNRKYSEIRRLTKISNVCEEESMQAFMRAEHARANLFRSIGERM